MSMSLWDNRMRHLVKICAEHHYTKNRATPPPKHFLSDFRVRRGKRVKTLSFKAKRGQQTLVTYNLEWLKGAVNTEGSFAPVDNVDEICEMIAAKVERR